MKDIELLQYVHETASMGVLGLRDLLPQVESAKMKQSLHTQIHEYQDIASDSAKLLQSKGSEPKDPGLMARLSSQAMATMKTLADSSDSKLAEMVIQGNNMGHQGAQAPPRLPGQRPQDPCPGREAFGHRAGQRLPNAALPVRVYQRDPPLAAPRAPATVPSLAGALGLAAAPFPGIAGRKSLSLLTRPENFFILDPRMQTARMGSSTRRAGNQRGDGGCKSPPSGVEVVPELPARTPVGQAGIPRYGKTSADGPLGLSELRWYRGSPFALSP